MTTLDEMDELLKQREQLQKELEAKLGEVESSSSSSSDDSEEDDEEEEEEEEKQEEERVEDKKKQEEVPRKVRDKTPPAGILIANIL